MNPVPNSGRPFPRHADRRARFLRSWVPRGAVGVAMVGALAAAVATSTPGPVHAGTVSHDAVVSANPIDHTPDVMDGTVWDVAHVGPNKYVAAGTFTSVKDEGDGTTQSRTGLVLFNAATGHVYRSFAPDIDGDVRALWPSSDGKSVFVGGSFSHVNGISRARLARIDLSDGGNTAGFHPPTLNGTVYDLTVANDMLYVAGVFTKVGSTSQTALTALTRSTGARKSFFDGVHLSGNHNGGLTKIYDMESQPSGNHLVLVGDFGAVNGQSRQQVAMLTTGTSRAALTDWSVPNFGASCGSSFEAYVRDVAYGPAGHYVVVVSSGGAHAGTYCDAAVRLDTDARGSQKAVWTNYTGGDTLSAVEITGAAVYVGGHQRWMDNPLGHDFPGPGAVERSGIAALSTSTGKALSWNPGRKDRGVAVRVLRAVPSGLWMGSDTCTVAGESHCRVTEFPLS